MFKSSSKRPKAFRKAPLADDADEPATKPSRAALNNLSFGEEEEEEEVFLVKKKKLKKRRALGAAPNVSPTHFQSKSARFQLRRSFSDELDRCYLLSLVFS